MNLRNKSNRYKVILIIVLKICTFDNLEYYNKLYHQLLLNAKYADRNKILDQFARNCKSIMRVYQSNAKTKIAQNMIRIYLSNSIWITIINALKKCLHAL